MWDTLPDALQHQVLKWLSLFNAINLALTCWHNYHLYKQHVQHRVYKVIANWQFDPTSLLGKMKDHKVIISGSTPLAVLGESPFVPGDIDFFVPPDSMKAMIMFFVDEGDYIEVPNTQDANAQGSPAQAYLADVNGISDVKIFKHSTFDKVINLIETKLSLSPSAVMLFHSTPVMNFITWNSIVCAYPWMTDKGIGMVNTHRKEPINKMKECVKKHEDRGFVFVDHSKEWLGDHVCGSQRYCSRTVRSILDQSTMRLDFTSPSNVTLGIRFDTLTNVM